LVAVLLVSLFGALEYVQVTNLKSQNRVLTSSLSELQSENQNLGAQVTGNSSADLTQAWLSHLAKLANANITGAAEDYTPNAKMIYYGVTFGLGGNYTGTGNIRETLQALFGEATNFHFTIETFNSTIQSNASADIGANLSFAGLNHIMGEFNGTISAEYHYIYQNGAWLISDEYWNFETGNFQYKG